ncbi:MAG: DUF4138 domain-containing protein [Sedimentibacter sp.]|uniref:DUF4138 domain-containing protein n=1 Tax=Sedimentibacter sp. TaxID=1960295 RepID=UPI002981BDE9|nr:DUF4138 domain-containing protein [Sedimentibacter sp.]MDW5298903.1 DUF4138 domain-containing protein [Sedimentibacter sp.]
MRNILLTVFLAFLAGPVTAQNMGVIEVNKDFTATLNFTDSIVFIVVGNNPSVGENRNKYYDIFQNGKNCVIRGNDPLSPETSITVKLDNEKIWYGRLKYGDSTKIFYDFTSEEVRKIDQKKMKEVVSVESNNSKMRERLNSVLSDKVEYSSIGKVENGMTFQIANIKNDDNFTYFKLIVINNTGSDYNIDGIHFKVVEGKRKGMKKNEAKIEQRIKIEFESPIKVVSAYQKQELGYVTERFTGGKDASLIIQIRELKGTRNPIINISGDKMLNVKVFEQKLLSDEN